MTETTLDNTQSEHIFLIQQYKDEILDLQKKCAEKDKLLLERDKKVPFRFLCFFSLYTHITVFVASNNVRCISNSASAVV